MSLIQERKNSQALELPSNNPFRNRAASPILPGSGQTSPMDNSAPPRPVSRNPFLDASPTNLPVSALQQQSMATQNGASGKTTTSEINTLDLFDDLNIDEKRKPSVSRTEPPRRMGPPRSNADKGSTRGENVPPRGPSHRPTRSQEDAMRSRRAANGGRTRPNGESKDGNVFADQESPRKTTDRRPRRNSDSSVTERSSKPSDSEEERKRRERHRRERKARDAAKDPKSKKPDRKLDIIDQLDATSIYGTGLFHHDGPFDACNPHRNRTGSRRAPMKAFPKDSLNNIIGGGGPLNKRPDHATFLGHNDQEGYKDYAIGGALNKPFDSYSNNPSRAKEPDILSPFKSEVVHGEETMGLGTSTFLDGAPASRTAIKQKEVETAIEPEFGGGLARKKSLAQKIRGISNNRREHPLPSGRITSPDGVYSPTSPGMVTPGGTKVKSDVNPFFNEFEASTDGKNGESITIVEPADKPGRSRAPSSPKRFGVPLERRTTGDGGNSAAAEEKPMGFLSRVKSLKGGPRKPREPKPMPIEK